MTDVSAEDEKDRHNRMAKMRSLLFRHEMKSKHIKKIKSKTYHRLLKKDRLKASSTQSQMDREAAKELAMKQEYERAKERMTLRHKGSSKWTKRIKERGIDVQDEGTRTAIAEQQHLHALLTRKMNSMKDGSSSSSDDTSDEDVYSAGSDQARASKLLEKAKEKTLNLLDEDDEVPKSGVLSLPFMVRGLKKRNEAAAEEAKLALQEYESWSNQLEDSNGADNAKVAPPSGRMVFNASKKEAPESSNKTQSDDKIRSDNYYGNSDSEDDFEPKENVDIREDRSSDLQNNGGINPVLLHKESKNHKDSLFKTSLLIYEHDNAISISCGSQNFDDIVQDPGPKTTHEVSIFASGTWKKMKGGNNADANANKPTRPLESVTKESSGNAKEIPAGGDGFSGKGVKEDVLVKRDYLISAMKAVCDKLKQANGKVLVSDIKKDLGYSGTRPGNRAWSVAWLELALCGKIPAVEKKLHFTYKFLEVSKRLGIGRKESDKLIEKTETNDTSSERPPAVLKPCRPCLSLTVDGSIREERIIKQLQDKGDGVQSQKRKHASLKRKRTSEARSVEFTEVDERDGNQEIEQEPEPNEDGEGCYSTLSKCAFSKLKPTRQSRFSWTEEADRQLVIQYARRCATLGAKYHHQISWASLPDLPAPPSTCKRRMSYLKNSNGKFRKSLMMLCNMLSKRYAKLLEKTKNRSLNNDECRQLLQGSTGEDYNMNFPNISGHNQGRSLQEEPWDNFDDNDVKKSLDEILHYQRMTRLDATKRYGSTYEEGSDLNTNAEENDPKESELIVSTVPYEDIQNHSRGVSAQRLSYQQLHNNFFKLLHEGVVSTPAYKSLAVELFKLVFLSTTTAPEEQNLVAEIRQRYSKCDLYAALNYLRDNKILIWGQLSISPCLPDEGVESSASNCVDFFKDDDTSSGEKHFGGNDRLDSTSVIPRAGDCDSGGAHSQRETNMNVNDVHKVTILSSPEEVAERSYEKQTCSVPEGCMEVVSARGHGDNESSKFTCGKLCVPILPWINGDGTINKIIYEGLRRRLLGIVMQNPGMLEDEIMGKMDVLNAQTRRKLLELMVLDKHVLVRKMRQNVYSGLPAILRTLPESSFPPQKLVFREHFFANSMSSSLL
ncbi:B-block binding subunit of TFIIIC [Prunus dulcis]|uniref:B-block binding subunit of TFIIIC n=1 Tax=Prunus dulcis TaxID=3755 RepID=A0A4Y1S139_PRUDU|nr:B-block binding subunit of TFIIIC [Prunus dulcis]